MLLQEVLQAGGRGNQQNLAIAAPDVHLVECKCITQAMSECRSRSPPSAATQALASIFCKSRACLTQEEIYRRQLETLRQCLESSLASCCTSTLHDRRGAPLHRYLQHHEPLLTSHRTST